MSVATGEAPMIQFLGSVEAPQNFIDVNAYLAGLAASGPAETAPNSAPIPYAAPAEETCIVNGTRRAVEGHKTARTLGTVVAGVALAATMAACRGDDVDGTKTVHLEKGTAVYDYASDENEKDTTAEQCGTTRATVDPVAKRQYTDPNGKQWWGFSALSFSTDGNCDTTGLLWVPK